MDTDRVWAISCVRDEADIIEYTVRQMFSQGVDGAIVSISQMSQDGTRQILSKLAKRFNLILVNDPTQSFYFYQDKVTTQLAETTHVLGADWIIPFDADEMFYSTSDKTVATQLRESRFDVFTVPMLNYFATSQDNPKDKNPLTRERWRKREPNPLNKVCFRWQTGITVALGNHHVIMNNRYMPEHTNHAIEIGHFQNRSPEHWIRKIRYEAQHIVESESERMTTGHWWRFNNLTDEQIADKWRQEYYFPNPESAGLVYDPTPYLTHQKAIA